MCTEYTDEWVDAQQMTSDHPETFESPSRKELKRLCPGAIVKIGNGEERFWTIVKSIDPADCNDNAVYGRAITAEVNNELLFDHGYNFGDIVTFRARHAYNIMYLCANDDCKKEATKICSKCRKVKYCCGRCQKKDWKDRHKIICIRSDNSGE